jgi:unsaturated rhamnogalacturonyl hydrolase
MNMSLKFMIKPGNIFFLVSFLIITLSNSSFAQNRTPWSIRIAESEMQRHPNLFSYVWDYGAGTTLKGFDALWRSTNDSRYFNYIKSTVDFVVGNNGMIWGYNKYAYNLDMINEGRLLLTLYNQTGQAKYKIAADTLHKQLAGQHRVSEGGFWHKDIYPYQMWLDGVFMANPFYTEYGKIFNEPADFDDVAMQIIVMEKHARDEVTGLLYHGWDESKQMSWANSITGCSPCFWGRGVGWYSMALVDVLDNFPIDNPDRIKIIAVLQRLAEALKKVQDPEYGTWYQVLDQGTRAGNYRESSASCDFVYTLAKAVNKGYIDQSYWDVVKKGYAGILNEFITIDQDEKVNVIQTCQGAGLGGNPYREGTYEYYIDKTRTGISTNDSKTVGPFILASLELEKTGFIMPPLNFNARLNSETSILLTWEDKSYNADGFIIQKKIDVDNHYKEIARVNKGTVSYIDNDISGFTFYRAVAYNNSSVSDPSNGSGVIIESVADEKTINTEFKLYHSYPNPFNNSVQISFTANQDEEITISIYDMLGQKVKTVYNGKSGSNFRTTFWDGTNDYGQTTTSGSYIVLMKGTNQKMVTKKIVFLK